MEAQTADWGIWHGSRTKDRLDSIKKKKKKILLNCGITVVQALSTSICLESNSHCMSHRLTDQNYCGKLTVRREEESGEKL